MRGAERIGGFDRVGLRGQLEREWGTVRTAIWAENWTAALGAICRALHLIGRLRGKT